MERVVIYRLGSLGDTIAALPCFHLIERAFPDAQRLVLTNVPVSNKAAPLEVILRDGGFIHGSIAYPRGTRDAVALLRLARRLRRTGADTLVYLGGSRGLAAATRDVMYFKLCGFSRIIGAPTTADLQKNRVDGGGELEPESHRLGRTLASLGEIDFADRSWWDLRLSRAERASGLRALGDFAERPFVAVNTGGKAVEKDWGEANWSSLLGDLAPRTARAGLVFVGSVEDGDRAKRLGASWDGDVLDLCGKLTPRESAAVLARARVFIGHDSGPLHLADAVNTPSVGLFGDYNRPRKWHPGGVSTTIIHSMAGLTAISPQTVVDAAVRAVDQAASRHNGTTALPHSPEFSNQMGLDIVRYPRL